MAHRSINRNILETKMKLHPEQKAELLVHSPHRRHKKLALEMTQRVANAVAAAKSAVEETGEEVLNDQE